MTMPARPATVGDLEPGWSRDEPNPYGPCYQRHVPGKGTIRVVARSGQVYTWYLSTRYRSAGLSWPREGFARPRDAMRDADQRTPLLAPRMFESLTLGETQELYRKLARAHDWGRHGPRETELDEVRGELFRHMRVLEADPSYHGPELHKFIHAVREASRGAALQAMSASPNMGSWLSMTSHGKPQRLAAAASSGEAERVMAPVGRTSAPGLAGSSFPAPAQTGLSAAPPGPAPQARQNPPDQARGRRR